jgi:hypothetical protein
METPKPNDRCYYCERPIDMNRLETYCFVTIKDEDDQYITNDAGDLLFTAVCVECGREIGAPTAAELRASAEREESGESAAEGPIQ